MKTIQPLIRTHLTKYPLMELTDMIKLLYQNEFGPGHMISDESESLKRLTEEWESLPRLSSSPLTEPIGNHLVRVHLAALNREELSLLNAMFCRTAGQTQGNREQFMKRLDCLSLYFPHADGFLTDYKKRGCPPVGHSNHYRKAYQPAYRVISESYASFLQLIRTFAALLQERGTLTAAIDGNCASGKTTLSRLLSMRFDCNIIPMDDFFLPPSLRTAKRLAEPGGNVHYERFKDEIMQPLQNGSPISYLPFCCSRMDYGSRVALPPKPFTVIEGSYCMRPELRGLYDYSVFLSCSYEQQINRIRSRNGKEMLKNFMEKWIPMENTYFDAFQVKENCNVIIQT